MGPSRRPTTTTFVNFAPAPLRGCDSAGTTQKPLAWRGSLLLRIGVLASISGIAAVKFL